MKGMDTPQVNVFNAQKLSRGRREDSKFAGGLFEAVWHHSLDAMCLRNEWGMIVAVNPAYSRLVETDPLDLIGKPFSRVFSFAPEEESTLERFRQEFQRRTIKPFQCRAMTLRSGKQLTVELTSTFVQWRSGETFLLTIARDVTEQSRARQRLEKSEEEFRSIFESVHDVIFLLNRRGIIESLNPAFESVTGWSRVEWYGRHFSELVPEEDLHRIWKVFRETIRTNNSITLELRVPSKSGQILVGEFCCKPCVKEGKVVGILGIVRDITEKVKVRSALRESERNYREMVEFAVQGMFQSTPSGKLLAANPALLKMLGYDSFEELASIDLRNALYLNPADRDRVVQGLETAGASRDVEIQLRRKDGKIITVLEHARVVKDEEGRVLRYEGIIEDITDRKALEAKVQEYLAALKASAESLKQLNAQKDKLFSVLSHDLRSPFSSILGFCEVLLSEGDQLSSTERQEFITYIKDAAEQQLKLVNKLLDWSRLETGRIKMDVQELDLSTVIKSSVATLLGTARQKDILLYSSVPPNVMMRGDAQLLVQVFNNLISNALKFTPAKGVVSIELNNENDATWEIKIRDTGIGIPKADLAKLFKVEEKYTRTGLDGEIGTGLGLPLVYEIVQKHDGSISVESVIGEGTTFILRFPKCVDDATKVVMIVDNDRGVRAMHSRYLHKLLPHAEVLAASDGEEALKLAALKRPDLILTDYAMPGMNGYELLCRLKKEGSLKEVPVVVITGEDSVASREALALSGAAEVLSKPVSMDAFGEVLRRYVGGVDRLHRDLALPAFDSGSVNSF
jgi:PAS domain S-box-containing protein